MSKARLVSALAAAMCMLAAAAWIVTGAFPLAAAPQVVADAPGVTVNLSGAAVLHRAPVRYPTAALIGEISGTVVVEVTLDGGGNVNNVRVVSGPDELRRAALESILQWHFARDSAGKTRQVSVNFLAPSPVPGVLGSVPVAETARKLESIVIAGIPESLEPQLLATLPVHLGDSLPVSELATKLRAAAKQFDEHLEVAISVPDQEGAVQARIWIPGAPDRRAVIGGVTGGVPGGVRGGVLGGILSSVPGSATPLPPPSANPDGTVVQRIRVGGNVQAARLVQHPPPVYPPLARQARISGVVKLSVVIATDGTVKDMSVASGHPLLVQAALEAVRQWVYQPTLLNGVPVEVATEVDVNFSLAE